MRVTRLSLRNFRVFPELELEVPPGVVGIYGPNGAGKSTLVESILWALFGVARTGKESLRSDGATGETVATVEFEHDGHLYEVMRSLSGAANGVKAEAACDGLRVSAGAVAVRQYVHQVLGMSAEAFRSSVFCEQKQLDAFSGRRPEERRKLVLDLLGITPLDRARDSARAQARSAVEQIEAARQVLGDLEALAAEATELEGRLVAAGAVRVAAAAGLATAEQAEAAAAAVAAEEERRKQERDRLAALYAAARRRHEDASARLAERCAELAELESAAVHLPALTDAAAELAPRRAQLDALEKHDVARGRLSRAERELAGAEGAAGGEAETPTPLPALKVLEEEAAAAGHRSGEAAGRVTAAEAALAAARLRLEAAATEVQAAAGLDPRAPCPLCGQELGASFDEVQRHREAARQEAADAVGVADAALAAARSERSAAEQAEQAATDTLRQARRRHERCAALRAEVVAARAALEEAETLVAATVSAAAGPSSGLDGGALRRRVAEAEAARDGALRLEERLKAKPALAAAVATEEAAVAEAGEEAAGLLALGKALCFDAAAHGAASAARAEAVQAVERARAVLTDARLDERGLSERLSERRSRIDAEVERRAELAGRESEARHLGRLAELLGEFRNSLVAQVGPALSVQTTALFRELTDGRFDSLEVDGDSFELRVGSAGHPLDRHSGSETDLANLSLRVAIGEQVNLLSGGAVGLLVLDEVLGALDGEHRDRLLGALTRLGARFRQVLFVTHAVDVKEQLPHAIEVEPVGGGRSRAASATGRICLAEVS
jgi:DNA repair exonuclease SbcCD ATPase subunit